MSQVSSRPDTSQGQRRTFHNKTSFGIIPTPPSPTHSSPPLTQSTSNSSVSPPHPSTPPPRYNRSRARYPTDLGRVPLHRRGTSQTYEPFEDLLREAGYKETRIFTPESERVAEGSSKNGSPQESKGRKVSAVVGFLTGLMPGAALKRSSSLRETYQPTSIATSTIQEYSPPPSPVSQRQSQKQSERPSTPRRSSSSIDGPGSTPRANPRAQLSSRSAAALQSQLTQNDYPYAHHSNASYTSLTSQHRHHGPQQSSTTRLRPSESPRQGSPRALPGSTPGPPPVSPLPHEPRQITHTIYHPRPSRASAYLRHMASTPNIPHRPNSTPAHQSLLHAQQRRLYRSKSNRASSRDDFDDEWYDGSSRGNGEGEEDHNLPPMPRTWLETVARAVLFGGAGAHVGGPLTSSTSSNHRQSASNPHNRPTHSSSAKQTPALRQARSIISRVQGLDNRAASAEGSSKYRGSRAHAHLQRTRSGLSDQTNRGHLYVPGAYSRSATATPLSASSRLSLSPMKLDTRSLAQPELLSRLGKGRSEASEGKVRRTRVVCRSAPTSRAGSRTRGGSVSGESKEQRRNDSAAQVESSSLRMLKDRGRRGGKGTDKDTVPSLARTRTEGDDDDWHEPGRKGKRKMKRRQQYRSDEENRYLDGWGWPGSEGGDGSESGSCQSCSNSELEDEEEEDGELDLAQMLVPPKRQNSIRSLRMHLVGSSGGALAAPSIHSSTGVVGASGVAGTSLMRRGSTRSSTVFDSGNSRIFRRWLAGDTMVEQWEDEAEGETGSSGFVDPRGHMSRRSSTEDDDELVIRLDNSSASRKSTRLGLPAGWGFN